MADTMTTIDPTEIGEVTLTLDQLDWCAEQLGVVGWPVVLGIAPVHVTADERDAALAAAEAELKARGLADESGMTARLEDLVQPLSWPDRELELRIYAESEIRRMSLVRRDFRHVMALRRGASVLLRPVVVDSVDTLGRYVLGLLGSQAAAEVADISATTPEFQAKLDSSPGKYGIADAMYAFGADQQQSMAMASALDSCTSYAELVAVAHEEGNSSQSSGAVAIYETSRGRVVASPSKSPDGRVWTTIGPGTESRIKRAIAFMIETLPDGSWSP